MSNATIPELEVPRNLNSKSISFFKNFNSDNNNILQKILTCIHTNKSFNKQMLSARIMQKIMRDAPEMVLICHVIVDVPW